MQDNQEAEGLNYRIPPSLAQKLVKVKGYKAVQEYLSLLKQVMDYKLDATKNSKNTDEIVIQASGWMGANEVIVSLDNLLRVAKEVVKEYNDYQSLLDSQTD